MFDKDALDSLPDGAVDPARPRDYRANVVFFADDLRRLVPPRVVRRNFERGATEDVLLWHVLRGLAGRFDLPFQRLDGPVPGENWLPLAGAGLAFWNRCVPSRPVEARALKVLFRMVLRVEPQVKRHSEFDAILYDPDRRSLAIVEAKLNAPPGRCGAVAPGGGGCRMYRALPDPKWNGCTYWGMGRGGQAFTEHFPDRLVERYLRFDPPPPERPLGSDCDRFYQLMRAWLIGCETIRALGPGHSFQLVVIAPKRRLGNGYYAEFARQIRPDATAEAGAATAFGVVSWEKIRDRLPKGDIVRSYLEHFGALNHDTARSTRATTGVSETTERPVVRGLVPCSNDRVDVG